MAEKVDYVPDWMPIIGTREKFDNWFGGGSAEAVHPQEEADATGFNYRKEWAPGDQSWLTQNPAYKAVDAGLWGGLPSGYKPSEVWGGKPLDDTWNWLTQAGRGGNQQQEADPYANIRKFRDKIDFEDKESIKELQGYLGVEQDGMFGPKTEEAWRKAAAGMDVSDGKEALRYDWNQKMLDDRVRGSKTGLGGLLKQAYTGLDKKVGGILPGGYRKDKANMTAEDFYGK